MKRAQLTFALTAAGIALASTVPIVSAEAHPSTRDWKPCRTPSTMNCVYDAKHMGDRKGDSFKHIFTEGGTVKIVFITHRRAHFLLHADYPVHGTPLAH